jgi:tRNA (pseudouridine54-N1)-methyltransferase
MRQFVVVGHEVPAAAEEISLEDLPGAGRLDVLCRCVNSAFFLSHDLRESVRVHLVVDGYVVRFEGSELRRLNPDERSTGALIRDALAARENAIGAMEANPSPGVYVGSGDLGSTLEALGEDHTVIQLHEAGDPIAGIDRPSKPAFVLSDHHSFTEAEEDLLEEHAETRVSVGPKPLHADHAITVAHNYLDTDGYAEY